MKTITIELIRSAPVDGKWRGVGEVMDVPKEVAAALVQNKKAKMKEKPVASGKRK